MDDLPRPLLENLEVPRDPSVLDPRYGELRGVVQGREVGGEGTEVLGETRGWWQCDT